MGAFAGGGKRSVPEELIESSQSGSDELSQAYNDSSSESHEILARSIGSFRAIALDRLKSKFSKPKPVKTTKTSKPKSKAQK